MSSGDKERMLKDGDLGPSFISSSLPANPSMREKLYLNRQLQLKYASLVTLTVQNAALTLLMRMARTQKELFLNSSAVIVAEAIKIITCLVMVAWEEKSIKTVIHALKVNIVDQPKETIKMAVPAILYYIQNNLIYVAAGNLDPATSSVTYQLKLITTAAFSVLMLRKKLFKHQWGALVLLFVGIAMVQLVQLGKSPSPSSAPTEQSAIVGFGAILCACVLSGFAGIYFELLLKGSNISLWVRNIQLAGFSVPFGLLQSFSSDWDQINDKGFFYGFTFLTWVVVLLQAQGGLLVAVVVKYADNILKGFATSLSIIISCIVSIYLFQFEVTLSFVVGGALVIGSIFLYGKPGPTNRSSALPQSVRQ